jgi:altronate dehydratase small subunit
VDVAPSGVAEHIASDLQIASEKMVQLLVAGRYNYSDDKRGKQSMVNALVVNKKDNVATALRPLEKGESIGIEVASKTVDVVLEQAIPFGHKLALEDIERGERIIKYGETIGQAMEKINKGEHVHIHNVEGLRGRGDKR